MGPDMFQMILPRPKREANDTENPEFSQGWHCLSLFISGQSRVFLCGEGGRIPLPMIMEDLQIDWERLAVP